jgi:uncharacterized protein DUF4276
MIQPIVEGDGEVQAVPVLLRRLMVDLGIPGFGVRPPIRQSRSALLSESGFRKAIRLARLKPNVTAILVLFDADDDCARDIVPRLLRWGQAEAPPFSYAVVLARREYEAWFLASLASLRGKRHIRNTAAYPGDPEAVRDAKGVISHLMPRNMRYIETADQVALSAQFDLGEAYRHASSFRKLVKEVHRMLGELGYQPLIPADWMA